MICLENDFDGETILEAKVEQLVKIGFLELHANRALVGLSRYRREHEQKAGEPAAGAAPVAGAATAETVTMFLPLTEIESQRMLEFAKHYSLINVCRSQMEAAIESVTIQKRNELNRCKQAFDTLVARVASERSKCRASIVQKHAALCDELKQKLDALQKILADSKEQEAKINNALRITDWSQRQQRLDAIMGLSKPVLEAPLPSLVTTPQISVNYDGMTDIAKVVVKNAKYEIKQTLAPRRKRGNSRVPGSRKSESFSFKKGDRVLANYKGTFYAGEIIALPSMDDYGRWKVLCDVDRDKEEVPYTMVKEIRSIDADVGGGAAVHR